LAYFFLFLRGVMHLIVALYRGGFHPPAESLTIDMILLSVVMFIELSLAVTTKTTTLHRWAYMDYGTHHFFFIATVFPAAVVCPATVRDRWAGTLVMILCSCLNLAVTASRSAGAAAALELPNRLVLLPVLGALIGLEVRDSWEALMNPGSCATVLMTIMAAVSFGAPLYHLSVVTPHSFMVIKRGLGYGPTKAHGMRTRAARKKEAESDMRELD